jgi:hypothetical protein
MSPFSLNGSAPALKGVPDASWEVPKEPARVTKMIAAVLKKCIFFLLEQTGRWRGEEPRHPKPLTEPPSSQAAHVKSTLCSGAVGLIG